jgi:ubiquitin-activating enzyme E1-like protein 2
LKPTETNQFLTDSRKDGYWAKFRNAKPSKPDVVKSVRLLSMLPRSFADCVQIAVNKFNSFYRNQIMQLLFNYPPDVKDKDGKPFWVAPRRMPRALTFDAGDDEHLAFAFHCAHLYANVFKVKDVVNDMDAFRKVAKQAKNKEYVVKTDKFIESDESAKKEEALAKKREKETYSGNEFEEMVTEMQRLAAEERSLLPEDFEKDVDSNHHIDFITAAANLRNVQYSLETSDRLRTKKIAGRIIPAMATSTSAVSGLVSIEMIKVILGIKDLTKYKNAWVNLALPAVLFSEPQPCPLTKIHDELSITLWTKRWEVRKGNLVLGQFLAHFKKEFKLNVTGIFLNVSMIYAEIMAEHKKRIPVKMLKLLSIPENDMRAFVDLTCSFERLDGSDVTGPAVRYYLH